MKAGGFVLLIALAFALSGCNSAPPPSLDEQAKSLLRSGRWEEAIYVCSKAIHLNPADAGAYLVRGRAYQCEGKVDKAIADFTEAIRLAPEDCEAYYSRALAYQALGARKQAAADNEQAQRRDPTFARTYAAVAKDSLVAVPADEGSPKARAPQPPLDEDRYAPPAAPKRASSEVVEDNSFGFGGRTVRDQGHSGKKHGRTSAAAVDGQRDGSGEPSTFRSLDDERNGLTTAHRGDPADLFHPQSSGERLFDWRARDASGSARSRISKDDSQVNPAPGEFGVSPFTIAPNAAKAPAIRPVPANPNGIAIKPPAAKPAVVQKVQPPFPQPPIHPTGINSERELQPPAGPTYYPPTVPPPRDRDDR